MSASVEPPPLRGALSLGEAIERLLSLSAIEDLASLHGTFCLLVDFDRQPVSCESLAATRAIQVLERLACPSIAIARTPPDDAFAALLARFDVVVEREDCLPSLVETCRRQPLAALAWVQLLRMSEGLGIHDGLVAESLVYSTLQAGPEFAAWLAARRLAQRSGAPKPERPDRVAGEPAVRVRRDRASDGRERLRLSLNRPEKRNAFSVDMRDALVEALELAVADPEIAEIVLDGVGSAFCSGGDLDEFGSLPDPATAHAIRSTRSPARLMAQCSDRVHAYLHGGCVGAGIELPAFAGHVVAHPDAFFQLPESGLGLVPGAGGSVSIPRRIGRQRTAWLALSGERLDAPTALRWGLVDELRDWSHATG